MYAENERDQFFLFWLRKAILYLSPFHLFVFAGGYYTSLVQPSIPTHWLAENPQCLFPLLEKAALCNRGASRQTPQG